MIKNLEISNFQSHKDSILEFSEGVNVITGTSDSGKSSVIRSILWVLKNRPSGDAIKNWSATDKEDVAVAIEFDNDWITKKRTKTKSQYLTEDGNYEALRSDVPDEIQKISNITDFNLQTQHQPYFLLQDSPGEVARKLNDLVGLSIIDTLFKNLNSKISIHKHKKFELEEAIESAKAELSKYAQISVLRHSLKKVVSLYSQLEKMQLEARGLRSFIDKIESLDSEIEKLKNVETAYILIQKIKPQHETLRELKSAHITLLGMVTKYESYEENITDLEDWLKIQPFVEKLKTDLEDLKKWGFVKYQLQTLIAFNDKIDYTEKEIKVSVHKMVELLRKEKICPTCESPITEKTIQKIKEKYS